MKKILFSILVLFLFIASCKEDEGNDVVHSEAIKQESPEVNDNHEAVLIEKIAQEEKEGLAEKEKEALAEKEKLDSTKVVAPPKPKEQVKPVVKKVKVPIISWVETTHSFGELKEGDKYEHKFKFKNSGNAPLVIKSAIPSCGCTIPSYPFIPIEPGEEGYIGIMYNSVGKSGRQTPDIKVVTNATPSAYTLTLEGEVLSKG